MVSASFVKFQKFVEGLGDGVFSLKSGGHTLMVYLSNDAPTVSSDVKKADVVPITEEHGYVATDIENDASQTGGTLTVTTVDYIEFTASGGSFGPFQYAVVYDDTPTTPNADPLVCYFDYGTPITVTTGEKFKIDFGASLLTLA
jgi:hypothetical protein